MDQDKGKKVLVLANIRIRYMIHAVYELRFKEDNCTCQLEYVG